MSTVKTGAEHTGRRWVGTEIMLDYIRPAAENFRDRPGFESNPAFELVRG